MRPGDVARLARPRGQKTGRWVSREDVKCEPHSFVMGARLARGYFRNSQAVLAPKGARWYASLGLGLTVSPGSGSSQVSFASLRLCALPHQHGKNAAQVVFTQRRKGPTVGGREWESTGASSVSQRFYNKLSSSNRILRISEL